jgi:NAD(P)-dependent dehydrogenase (short-subunit alcohol dehydrogenase family)
LSELVLAGRRVLVTGGSMGIGRASAEAVARAGARVVIAARGAETLQQAAAEMQGAGYDVHPVAADVSQPDQVRALIASVEARLGGIDGVVHAAAVLGPIGPATATEPEAWWTAVRANLFGSYLVATMAARSMTSGGSIVLFSGGGATSPFPNFSAYGCSKVAVVRFGETLAQELEGSGIRVNCLAPGMVATRMQDQTLAAGDAAGAQYSQTVRQRLQEGAVPAGLAAAAAVFLLSPAAEAINGRLLAAPWDDWQAWPEHAVELRNSDVFTLRRIMPADRGFKW